MRGHGCYWWLIGLIIFAGLCCTGCPGSIDPLEIARTKETLEEAQKEFVAVEELDAMPQYEPQYLEAHENLQQAWTYFDQTRLTEAYLSALKSLKASRQILKDYFLKKAKQAEETKAEIEIIQQKDPDTPLKDLLPQLDEILKYADLVREEKIEPSPDIVIEFSKRTDQIDTIKRTIAQATLESDFSFDPGQYELNDKGKEKLQQFAAKILRQKNEHLVLYPDKTVVVRIKTVGFTDEVPFREGTSLVKKLIEGFESVVPDSGIDRRRFLNQRLSSLRARTITDYFNRQINDPRIVIEQDIVGKGEELPPDVPPPHPISDPRRRICKIYSYVIAK